MTKGEKLDCRKSGGGSFPVTFDNEGECRSCGNPIYWCETPRGKKMPVDIVPLDDGYESHWATCPNADSHRGGGSAPAKKPAATGGSPNSETLDLLAQMRNLITRVETLVRKPVSAVVEAAAPVVDDSLPFLVLIAAMLVGAP